MSALNDHEMLDQARREAGLTLGELWLRYFELGGLASPLELEAHLAGLLTPDPLEREMVAHAINERFTELGQDHPVPYLSNA